MRSDDTILLLDLDLSDEVEPFRAAVGLGLGADWAWRDRSLPSRPGRGGGLAAQHGPVFLMSSDKDRRRTGNERMSRRPSTDAGFDLYLVKQLHEVFDPILEEPVPDHLTSLLNDFQPRPEGGAEAAGVQAAGGCAPDRAAAVRPGGGPGGGKARSGN